MNEKSPAWFMKLYDGEDPIVLARIWKMYTDKYKYPEAAPERRYEIGDIFKERPPTEPTEPSPVVRVFETGATRGTEEGKLDYEGFLSPIVLQRYAEFLHEHRYQADGKLRASDNWQKGMPKDVYVKSLWRHFQEACLLHRGYRSNEDMEHALCGIIFNSMGYLFEVLKEKAKP
jgi:hypothetical protein